METDEEYSLRMQKEEYERNQKVAEEALRAEKLELAELERLRKKYEK